MTSEEGQLQLTLMRSKEQALKQIMSKSISFTYDLIPLNQQEFLKDSSQLLASLKQISPKDKVLADSDEIILGKIQGQSMTTDFKSVIEQIVGQVDEESVKAYLKQKTEVKNYGVNTKDKNSSLRQIRKLQQIKKYFNVEQVAKKRKHNTLYRAYMKSIKKFLDSLAKIKQDSPSQTIMNAFGLYNAIRNQQKKYQTFVKSLTLETIANKDATINPQAQVQIENEKQIKPNTQAKIQSQHQNANNEKIQQQKNIEEQKSKVDSSKEIEKTPKKQSKKKKKGKTSEGTKATVQDVELDSAERERERQKEKALQLQKQRLQQIQRQKALQMQREQAAKKKFTSFFKKKDPPTPIKKGSQQEVKQPQDKLNMGIFADIQHKNKIQKQWLDMANVQGKPSIESLRSDLKNYKMQDEHQNREPYYVNIVMTLSIIEYFNYQMQPNSLTNFTKPFTKIEQIYYFQDESQQFEGQSATGQEQEQQIQPQQQDDNNTILQDDHLSKEEISDCDSQGDNFKFNVEYGKGNKWIADFKEEISFINIQNLMIFPTRNCQLPLNIDKQEEKIETIITPQTWEKIYLFVHGYYGVKQELIKTISGFLENVSKNWIDNMLKQRTQKVSNQRFIKQIFIDQLKDKIPQIEQRMTKIKTERINQQKAIKAEKNQQKDLQLEKDILECQGSRYIVKLFKYLKQQKGHKQLRKKELIQFINERKGQEWQKIQRELLSMSRPINQLMRMREPNQNGIRIDEEIEVQDGQWNQNPQNEQKQQIDNSTEEKQKALQVEEQEQEEYQDPTKRKRRKTFKMKNTSSQMYGVKKNKVTKGSIKQKSKMNKGDIQRLLKKRTTVKKQSPQTKKQQQNEEPIQKQAEKQEIIEQENQVQVQKQNLDNLPNPQIEIKDNQQVKPQQSNEKKQSIATLGNGAIATMDSNSNHKKSEQIQIE